MLDNLETQLQILVTKTAQLRKFALDSSLTNTLALSIRSEVAQLLGDVDKFQFEHIDAVIAAETNSGQAIVRGRRKSMNNRCVALRNEVNCRFIVPIKHLCCTQTQRTYDFLEAAASTPDLQDEYEEEQKSLVDEESYPNIPVLDDLEPDWKAHCDLQRKCAPSALCKSYSSHMQALAPPLPLCDPVFEYLQSPAGDICSASHLLSVLMRFRTCLFFGNLLIRVRRRRIEADISLFGLQESDPRGRE
jgi:hypothetical protein